MIIFFRIIILYFFMGVESMGNSHQELPKNTQNRELTSQQQEQLLQKQKEEILMFGKSQRQELSKEVISNHLQKYYQIDISKYSPEIAMKIVQEVEKVFKELKNYDESKIAGLREVRESMTTGLESGKSDEYYRNMILSNKIQERMTLLQESLKTILGEKIKVGAKEYNKQDYTKFSTDCSQLDKENGFSLFSKIQLENNNFDLKKAFAEELKKNIDPTQKKYNLISADITRLSQVIGEKGFENLTKIQLKNGQTINAQELYSQYHQYYQQFQTKNKIFDFGSKQLSHSTQGFGFDEKKYGVGYKELKEAYADSLMDIEKMSGADLVIMLRILSGALPFGVTNVVGGLDDLKQAKHGINYDGSMQGIGENMLGYFTGVLGISVVGGTVATIAKGPKLAKVISVLGRAAKRLGEIGDLGTFAKNEKIMALFEVLKGKIPGIDVLVEKIKKVRGTTENINTNGFSQKEKFPVKKIHGFIDELIAKADPKTLSLSKQELHAMGERSKMLLTEISESKTLSPEIITFLSNIKGVLGDKLGGMNLKSLTHILEAILDGSKIPPNPKIQESLAKIGDISQADFFALTAIFHDLDKNFMPAQFLPDLESVLKGHNLTSHQLDSANLFKTLSGDTSVGKSLQGFFEKSGLSKLPNGNQIFQKLIEIYKNILQFLETKGITDNNKKQQFIDLMFETIKGHAANTEFIQIDSAKGGAKALNHVQTLLKDASTQQDVKKIILPNLDPVQKASFEKAISLAKTPQEMLDISKKFILQRYIKVNIGKEIPIEKINLKDFDSLVQNLSGMNKNSEIKSVLQSGNIGDIEKIISQKTTDLAKNKPAMNHYLHQELSGEHETVRFAFNMNDIIGYTKPNSEGFIKLIGLEGGPQNGFDLLIASPMNSMLATLSELKAKSNIPEYKRMYESGLKNAQVLMDEHKNKMNTPFVYSKGMPEFLSGKEFQGKNFGQVYEKLSAMWPKFGEDINDISKFPPAFSKDLAGIKQYFAGEFKNMCFRMKGIS